MKKLYSASEIAALNLPNLPATKVGIRTFAARENWYHETRTGVGGTRRVYEIPARYLPQTATRDLQPIPDGVEESETAWRREAPVAGTIAAGSAKVDLALLETAMRALSEWEEERHVKVAEERRSAIVAILYDYLQNASGGGKEAMAVVLRALG